MDFKWCIHFETVTLPPSLHPLFLSLSLFSFSSRSPLFLSFIYLSLSPLFLFFLSICLSVSLSLFFPYPCFCLNYCVLTFWKFWKWKNIMDDKRHLFPRKINDKLGAAFCLCNSKKWQNKNGFVSFYKWYTLFFTFAIFAQFNTKGRRQ